MTSLVERTTLVVAAWNEEQRLPNLIKLAHERFPAMVIAVQESTDRTRQLAKGFCRPADKVIEHPHYGYGDASMPDAVEAVETDWVFALACDEMPDIELLTSLTTAVRWGDESGVDGFWIPFRSTVEGVSDPDEQSMHLRLFRRELRWPRTMHSRPQPKREASWPNGYIAHDRSLDEMMQDYLRYFRLGRSDPGWTRHNRLMMHDACEGVAKVKGWDFVTSFPWWPEVEAIAFR